MLAWDLGMPCSKVLRIMSSMFREHGPVWMTQQVACRWVGRQHRTCVAAASCACVSALIARTFSHNCRICCTCGDIPAAAVRRSAPLALQRKLLGPGCLLQLCLVRELPQQHLHTRDVVCHSKLSAKPAQWFSHNLDTLHCGNGSWTIPPSHLGAGRGLGLCDAEGHHVGRRWEAAAAAGALRQGHRRQRRAAQVAAEQGGAAAPGPVTAQVFSVIE